MTDQAASTSQLETGVSQLRCIGCGAVGENGAKSVRCAAVRRPAGSGVSRLENRVPEAGGLDAVGSRNSGGNAALRLNPLDESGVWRFREILPALHDWSQRHHAAGRQHAGL